jgi:hypothetical protein
MTEWHTPGDEPELEASEPPTAYAEPRRGNRRQTQLLVLAGVVIVAAVVLLVVVLVGGGSNGPAKGSPEAVADDFASAVRAGSAPRVSNATCFPARAQVLASAKDLLGHTTSASRQGSATVQGGVAALRLALTVQGHDRSGTLALSRLDGAWCVDAFAVTAAP